MAECTLSRPLVIPAHIDAALRCQSDEDNNGLDDGVEREIAECLAPLHHFHSGYVEPAQTVLYNTRVLQVDGTTLTGIVKFMHLWPRDDGFVLSTTSWDAPGVPAAGACQHNDHVGDSQNITVRFRVQMAGISWTVEQAGVVSGMEKKQCMNPNDPLGPRIACPGQDETFTLDHVNVYPSPGKHHFYWNVDPDDTYATDMWAWDEDCADPHDGQGGDLAMVGERLKHMPEQASCGDLVGATPLPFGMPPFDGLFPNLCERDFLHLPNPTINTHFAANHLMDTDGTLCSYCQESFCTSSFAGSANISDGAPTKGDLDDDGIPNSADHCPLTKDHGAPKDGCGLGGLDCDFDGIPDGCDPDPTGRNQYVAGGGVDAFGELVHPPTSAKILGANVGALRGGYADFDGDNVADGVDGCPSQADHPLYVSSAPNWNGWAETMNFTDKVLVPDPSRTPWRTDAGLLLRSNACDPYPVTETKFWPDVDKVSGPQISACKVQLSDQVGADVAPIDVRYTTGISANDPNQSQATRLVALQARRCQCAYDDSACTSDKASACHAGKNREQGGAPWRGWRPVAREPGLSLEGLTLDAKLVSSPILVQATTLEESGPVSMAWDWMTERELIPGAFAEDSFSTEGTGAFGFVKSHHVFAVQGLFEENAAGPNDYLTQTPGSRYPKLPTSKFPEPDVGDIGAALEIDDVASMQNRRLRASHGGSFYLESRHTTMVSAPACVHWLGALAKLWLPDPPYELRGPRLWGDGGPRIRDKVWIAPTEGWRKTMGLVAGAPAWMEGATASAPWTAVAEHQVGRLFVVEIGQTWSRFAVLDPATDGPLTVEMRVSVEGALPRALSASAQVIADEASGLVAVVDAAHGVVLGYDPALDRWSEHELPRAMDASYALVGQSLVGASTTGVWAMDILDGRAQAIAGVPLRARPIVTAVAGSNAVLIAGGLDAAGAAHDDIWRITPSASGPVVQRLWKDTLGGRLVAGEAVLAAGAGRSIVAYRRSTSVEGFAIEQRRTDDGWTGREPGQPAACAATDAMGARLCPTGSGPWDAVGRLSCGTDSPPLTCQGASALLVGERALPGAAKQAKAGVGGVWNLRPDRLEWRGLTASLGDASVKTAGLTTPYHFDAGPEGALVATRGGLRWVQEAPTSLVVSAAVPVCGVPLKVARLGASSWAVLTHTAISLVSTASGTPEVRRQGLLRARPGAADDWVLEAIGPTPPAVCQTAPSALALQLLAARSFVSPAGRDLFLSRGPFVARIALGETALEIERLHLVLDPLTAIRYDADGGRLYGVGVFGTHVFDFRAGGLGHQVGHSVGTWVKRTDEGTLSARVTPLGQVIVARTER